jgi:hypothetical protein
MVRMVCLDHQVHLPDAWARALDPTVLAAKVDAIRAEMPESGWRALSARLPALSTT